MAVPELSTWLTIGITAAAIVQAIFAGLLWRLQQIVRSEGRRTMVAVALDYVHPGMAEVRFENASHSGVLLRYLELIPRSQGRIGQAVKLDYRMTIPDYEFRSRNVTADLMRIAHNVDPADPVWTSGGRRTIFFQLRPHYTAIGYNKKQGEFVTYLVELENRTITSITVEND
jgi:hypothetical protein